MMYLHLPSSHLIVIGRYSGIGKQVVKKYWSVAYINHGYIDNKTQVISQVSHRSLKVLEFIFLIFKG